MEPEAPKPLTITVEELEKAIMATVSNQLAIFRMLVDALPITPEDPASSEEPS